MKKRIVSEKTPFLGLRMTMLSIVLPVNLILLILVLFINVVLFRQTVDRSDLSSYRFLWNPLHQLLEPEDGESKPVPEWIMLVVMDSGEIIYPKLNVEELMQGWQINSDTDRFRMILSNMSSSVPGDMTLVRFSYRDEGGVVYLSNADFPRILKVTSNYTYMVNLFLVTTLFFIFGLMAMYSLRKSVKKLVTATNRLRRREFSTPIVREGARELQELYTAIEEMRLEMKDFEHRSILFLLSLSHDLKTPLTSIKGYLEAFRDGVIEDVDDFQQVISVVLNKTDLLDSRISELLDIAKEIRNAAEEGGATVAMYPWFEEMNLSFTEEAQLRRREFTSSFDAPDTLIFRGKSSLLTRSVMNLFDNAVRYLRDDDQIRFTVDFEEERQTMVIRMEDSGAGIPEEERGRIFDLFYRHDKGRNTRGMGIGLAAVRYFVESHGGSVSCGSSSLGGALFEIRLPRELS